MKQTINIAEVLKDKPKGTKLYSPIYGEVFLDSITTGCDICVRTKYNEYNYFFSDGRFASGGDCLLFPSKDMRDWSKFAWKKGDVLRYNDTENTHVIFDRFDNDDYTSFRGKHYLNICKGYNAIYGKETAHLTSNFSLEEEDAAKTYINTINERLGGKLNIETLDVEEAKPEYEFNPLDYVLSNDNDDREWILCQFSHFDKKGNIVFVGGSFVDKKCVIPYVGNEDLLGTTKSLED